MTKANSMTIYGAFGGVNVGDEAIAETMMAQLSTAFPDATVRLICLPAKATLTKHGYDDRHPHVAARSEWRRFIPWLRSGPLVIGGGQMLNGAPLPKGLIFIALLCILTRLFGNKVAIIGVGTRAIQAHFLARLIVRIIARLATIIRVRDSQSRDALLACGVRADKIDVTADVVFSGVFEPVDRTPTTHDHLVFAVHSSPLVAHYDPATYAAFIDRMADLTKATKVTIAAHDLRPEFDVAFANAVQAACQTKAVVALLETTTQAQALYQSAALVVSSRMHPIILGLLGGAKVMPVAGSAKVADLAQVYGVPAPLPVTADTETLAVGLTHTMHGVPADLMAAAQSNFADLRTILL